MNGIKYNNILSAENTYERLLKKIKNKEEDDFWDDCYQNENNINKKPKILNNTNLTINSNNFISKSNSFLEKFPEMKKELKVDKNELTKRRKAKKRCISLFNYSYQQNYYKNSLYNEYINQKNKEELNDCTWKPKLNKINKKMKDNIDLLGKTIYERDKKRNKNKKKILIKEFEQYYNSKNKQYTFRPQLNNNFEKLNKMFNNNKLFLTDRENSEFIFRYKKARDEHMIKRFIELSVKDESYDSSFLAIQNRNYNQKYKDLLNVNNNYRIYGLKKLNNKTYGFNDNNNVSNNNNNIYYNKKNNYVATLRKKLNNMILDDSD